MILEGDDNKKFLNMIADKDGNINMNPYDDDNAGCLPSKGCLLTVVFIWILIIVLTRLFI